MYYIAFIKRIGMSNNAHQNSGGSKMKINWLLVTGKPETTVPLGDFIPVVGEVSGIAANSVVSYDGVAFIVVAINQDGGTLNVTLQADDKD